MVVLPLFNNMKKKLILILQEEKYTNIAATRYDFESYKKKLKYDIEVHELTNFILPGFKKNWKVKSKLKDILAFNTFKEWKQHTENLFKKYEEKKILVIRSVSNKNSEAIKVNTFLKKKNVKILEFVDRIFPVVSVFNDKFLKNLTHTIFNSRKKIYLYVKNKFFSYLSIKLKLQPDYLLATGKKSFDSIKNLNKKFFIIKGNSADYNTYLSEKNKKSKQQGNYGLFLEAPSPMFLGDSYVDGTNVKAGERGTPKIWFPALNKFFQQIENYSNIKIKIAPHPKVKHKTKFPKYYFNREVISEPLVTAAKKAKILITRDSSGMAYAAIYKKPVIFIFSNEFKNKKNNFLENHRLYAKQFNTEPVNINEKLSINKLTNLFFVDNKNCSRYITKYLTARTDNKKNYQVIGKLI